MVVKYASNWKIDRIYRIDKIENRYAFLMNPVNPVNSVYRPRPITPNCLRAPDLRSLEPFAPIGRIIH